ncbi:MAG: protein TolQ [Alphaproteobacteria bacterium CG_4_10_14_0_8_um_filter_37_21]|nr:MAG: protein TolQ [Alphaproteobacteria bacterium CG_4_10_14_0_8_um_filter_37_21]
MFDLFLQAEPLVKIVMLGLLVASVWSWAIIISKVVRVHQINKASNKFEESFWSGGSLDDLYDHLHEAPKDPMSIVFCSAMREWRRSIAKGAIRGTITQRIDRIMQLTVNKEMDFLEKNMNFLASLGSNGVIVGLFGTVIGIMNSFENIAAQQNTNLAVVAPGIAEALFATAIGLIAAIPAAIAFNKISYDLNRFANRLDAFCNEFGSIVSRQVEESA